MQNRPADNANMPGSGTAGVSTKGEKLVVQKVTVLAVVSTSPPITPQPITI